MTESMEADLLRGLGRHWGWVLGFGVVTLLLAIAVLAWPGETLLVLALLFGCQLVVYGIFRFVSAFAYHSIGGGTRVLFALLGMLSLIVGLWAIRHLDLTLLTLAVLLGIFWIVDGAVGLYTALSAEKGVPGRGWAIGSAVLSIVAGIILMAWPGISLLALAVVLGIWLLIFGIMEIVAAFQLRSATHRPPSAAAPPSMAHAA
jgi:uncharacterized membrane protein HdeD (DUF308 family)